MEQTPEHVKELKKATQGLYFKTTGARYVTRYLDY